MSKIINNLNQSLNQQFNLNELQDINDNGLQTEAKTVTAAINEIVGKQIISNAIGTPLMTTDAWNDMEAKINDLLSTFKTNMMNNGVTVESGDRFKSLIDKIATMAEEGQGKGVQFASNEFDYEIKLTKNQSVTIDIPLNLDFTPNYIFIYSNVSTAGSGNVFISNIYEKTHIGYMYQRATISITSLDKDLCTLNILAGADGLSSCRLGTWYAIGVGEEDTACGGLDIISAANLPTTGKDNQVCIISNNPDKNIILTPNSNEATTDTSFVVISSGSGTAIPVIAGNLTTHYYISEVRDNVDLLSSYYWSNNEWKKLTGAMTVFLKNGTFYNDSIHGGLTSGSRASYTAGTGIWLRPTYYNEDVWSYMFTYATLNKQINLSLYNKIELDLQLESAAPNYNTSFYLYKSSMTTNTQYSQDYGTPSGMTLIQGISITLKPNAITTISFDLTNHNNTAYLCFNHTIGYNVFIKGIRLYHN